MLPEERTNANQVIDKYFRLQSKDLALLKFILEGYEGLATVTTIDPRATSIRISTTGEFACELDKIIEAVRKEFSFEGFESLS